MLYPPKYLLRWRFDYLDKPSKAGMWMNPGINDCDKACYQNTTGLVRAVIEGKDIETRQTRILAECDGHDYYLFQWDKVDIKHVGNGGQSSYLIGMRLLTREMETIVDVWGEIATRPRPEIDKQMISEIYMNKGSNP